jgi:hypothetical protein
VLSVLREAIDADELAKLMATGATMPQDQAVEYALSINDHFRIGSGTVSSASIDAFGAVG